MTKKESQRIHAKKRHLERHGTEINRETYRQLISYIKGGKRNYTDGTTCIFLERQSERIAKFEIKTLDSSYIVVYDRKRCNIVTFLLPEEQYLEVLKGEINENAN